MAHPSVDSLLADLTECSICTEVFTDPRVLPCYHTFSLNCLLNCGRDRRLRDQMNCPLCREPFAIPPGGISAIKKDFKTEKWLNIRKILAGRTTCEKHEDRELKLFCHECIVAICATCFIESHKAHNISDIEELSDVLRDTQKISKMWRTTKDVLERLEKEKNDFIKHLAGIKDEINTSADKLIAAIQRDRKKLSLEVGSIRQKRVRQIEKVKQEVDQHKARLESFKRESETLLNSGTFAGDLTKNLHDRAEQLAKFDVIGHVDSSLPIVNVTFTSSALEDRDDKNLVGTVTGGDSSSPTVMHITPRGDKVTGVTSLGDDVFVLRSGCSQQKIEVYDAETFTSQRHITVPLLGKWCYGLAVCPVNKCLYASDHLSDSVHRVELSGSNAVMKWSVARKPIGLSLNSEHNVIVVSGGERKLQIFTTVGTLLQDIHLQNGIGSPEQSVQLTTEHFLVSHSSLLHRVCSVGVDGAVVRSYGGERGSELTQMNNPRGLAVDGEGRVLVADADNNRLLVMDRSLSSAREMSVTVDGGLYAPSMLWYDQSRRRLYIGEWHGGRVIVVDNVRDFVASQV